MELNEINLEKAKLYEKVAELVQLHGADVGNYKDRKNNPEWESAKNSDLKTPADYRVMGEVKVIAYDNGAIRINIDSASVPNKAALKNDLERALDHAGARFLDNQLDIPRGNEVTVEAFCDKSKQPHEMRVAINAELDKAIEQRKQKNTAIESEVPAEVGRYGQIEKPGVQVNNPKGMQAGQTAAIQQIRG